VNSKRHGVKRICSECKIENEPREITLHFERNGIRVKIVGVPAIVCLRCGQEYIAAPVSKEALKIAGQLAANLEATRATFVRVPAEPPSFRRIVLALA